MKKYEQITEYLQHFLSDEVRKTGIQSVVLGLSGGIDSAVVALLAQRVFKDNLLCVKMPS
ncbi:MAG: synthase, partial [Campylobacterota bacterium]|nr:synthase [Campylobacterota bacterium]